MDQPVWTSIFKNKTTTLQPGHSWRLEFDDTLVPDSPDSGWQQYIRNTGASFRCTKCGRTWPSNRVMVVFHMRLAGGQGVVKVRRFRQNCKMCVAAPMEMPQVTAENIDILMENLVKKIRIKCYHENLDQGFRRPVDLDVKSPHEPAHCEACKLGICTKNEPTKSFAAAFNFF